MTARSDKDHIRLYGRIFLSMDIRAVTGLRIGGAPAALAIGGLDNPVIRDPLTQTPYIPGSSLRGKMRSLWEKINDSTQEFPIQQGKVYIHSPRPGSTISVQDYEADPVYRIFGVTGDISVPNPTRLVVHDVHLSDESAERLERSTRTDQPYTETKWEATIDRITSAAVPRQMERVPADTVFSDARLVYSIFSTRTQGDFADVRWFFDVIQMLQLVEDDYLGSSGSRGSGQVEFTNLRLGLRFGNAYGERYDYPVYTDLGELYTAGAQITEEVLTQFSQRPWHPQST